MSTPTEELVVLLTEDGHPLGTTPKRLVHHHQTPLHLAFSCYVLDPSGSLLVTRRALHKPTWPGVWTNSFCGHPAPGEDLFDAVRRRGEQELGLVLDDLQLTLPRFRYTAVMANGVRENELCPVFTATTRSEVRPDPAEVEEHRWVPWTEYRDAVLAGAREVSPWSVTQVGELAARESTPGVFVAAAASELPPAAVGFPG